MTQPGPEREAVGPVLGARIRAHRQLRRMSLRTLAALSGTSPRVLMTVGDSVEYRTSVPHGVRNVGAVPAEVYWIISPPTSRTAGGSHALAVVPRT